MLSVVDNEPFVALAMASAVGLACGFRPFLTMATLAVAAVWGAAPAAPPWQVLASGFVPAALVVLAGAEALSEARVWRGQTQDLLLAVARWPIGIALVLAIALEHAAGWFWLFLAAAVVLIGCGQATQSALRALLQIIGVVPWLRRANHVVTLALPLGLWLAAAQPTVGMILVASLGVVSLPAAFWQLREWRSLWRRRRLGPPQSA